ncbi:hypothetical protein UFOVP1299_19 [uncultured Caudovirales phage]|uniref:Uncharacterized protein n=1 Tax=uncultured Caudovirales phage TaxID=2100421 RepID=A0A6J5RPK5_9CAUD|nr:hypothetical protein UFOVP1299_19 [uncultured Caudovirales phage]
MREENEVLSAFAVQLRIEARVREMRSYEEQAAQAPSKGLIMTQVQEFFAKMKRVWGWIEHRNDLWEKQREKQTEDMSTSKFTFFLALGFALIVGAFVA